MSRWMRSGSTSARIAAASWRAIRTSSEYYVHLHFSHARVALAPASTAKRIRRSSVGERVLRAMARATPTGPRPGFDLDNHVFYLFTQIQGRRNRDLALDLEPLGVSVPQW